MVFQTLDEIKVQLLIEPDLTLNSCNLGNDLFFLMLNEREGEPDFILDFPSKIIKLKDFNGWVIELKSKEDILTLLYDLSFHFDYSLSEKTFRYR